MAVEIPAENPPEPPYSKLIFSQDVPINGPAGCYQCFAVFESGAAAEGGEYTFWVDDPATMPPVTKVVTLWGNDEGLARWLEAKGIHTIPFASETAGQEVILVGHFSRPRFRRTGSAHLGRRDRHIPLSLRICTRGSALRALR